MNIPTRDQLRRLAAHNLLEDRVYTQKEVKALISTLIEPATRKQLNRLAAHDLLENRDYTKEEAKKLISAVFKSGARPNWQLADTNYFDLINTIMLRQVGAPNWQLADINYWDLINTILLRQAKNRLAQLQPKFFDNDTSKENMDADYEICQCDEIIDDVKLEKEGRKEFLRDRIREYQDELNPTGWEPTETGISPWRDQIKKPKIAQVKACVEVLDTSYPGWEEIWGTQSLVNTLLHNFPELQKY